MARQIGILSAMAVNKQTKPGLYADGGGLYLQVTESGAKTWIFRFMMAGKRRDMGLGPLHTISLAEARQAAAECRKLKLQGIDPITKRQSERLVARVEVAKVNTFKQCAEAYITAHEPAWRNAKHGSQWRNTLTTYVYPVFGELPVNAVDTGLVMTVLEPIWATKTETASRLRGRVEAILDWAAARKFREGENPARWKGHLDKLLPARGKVQKVEHHPALPYEQIGTFMKALREQEGIAARGLELQILTATRTGEVIGAVWDEIDLENKVWMIPASRMKAGKEHRIPLAPSAISLIETMQKLRVSTYVFPGGKKDKPLSNMAFLKTLERMKRSDLTAHGFRSTFRDWVAEKTDFSTEVAEMALAHTVGDKVEAAYRRGDLFDKRRMLMGAWGQECGVSQT
jgi:integrase